MKKNISQYILYVKKNLRSSIKNIWNHDRVSSFIKKRKKQMYVIYKKCANQCVCKKQKLCDVVNKKIRDTYQGMREYTWKQFMRDLRAIPRSMWVNIGVLLFLMIIVIVAHTYNFFAYPYYENDEGTYISQAHALITQGKLSPYVYWYDHAPGGWIIIAFFAKITGALFAFDTSVNFGRVLMLGFHILSAMMIYVIAKRLSKGYVVAIISTIIFALSPLAIYYQRRVLLDNMMTTLVLCAIAILYKKRITMNWIIASAILFASAVLVKETALVFLPALLIGVWQRRKEISCKWVSGKWLIVVCEVMALYPWYAFVRGELFDAQGGGDHVSLLGTLSWQLSRTGSDIAFWHKGSEFMNGVMDWLYHDPYIIIAGFLTGMLVVVWSLGRKDLRVISLGMIFFFFYLLRSNIVLNFYIVPLIPFLALSIALIVERLARYIADGYQKRFVFTSMIFVLIVVVAMVLPTQKHFMLNETQAQIDAVHWVKKHVPTSAKIAIDDYMYTDYHDARFGNGKVFNHADIFWKIESDPQVRNDVYNSDWRTINYVVGSSTFDTHRSHGQLEFVGEAASSAVEIVKFVSDDTADAYQTRILKVDPDMPVDITYAHSDEITDQLYRALRSYKKFFFRTYGQIVDPDTSLTTSEGQSYAMLRSVWVDDKETFDGVWEWTQDHLQFRIGDNLISWKWALDKLEDSSNATDADEDIALALLFAYAQWGDERYLTDAKKIIDDIGDYAVVEIAGKNYVLSSHWKIIEQTDGFLLNPSYLAPAHYRIFAEVDPKHDWQKIARDSYDVLARASHLEGNVTGLPADWVLVDKETGELSSAQAYFDYDVDKFSFDAFRVLWRVSLDYQWFNSLKARTYLDSVNTYLIEQYKKEKTLPSEIASDGTVIAKDARLAVDAGYLAAFMIKRDALLAKDFFEKQFVQKYNDSGEYWGDDKYNYYDANWAWFATAMYNGNMKNLFAVSE
ncbi:MAG: hypothetical protein CR972_02295 [Candidatus Moraniibacteriota bacterium]|nr:MAG: hypothetical protein CR972_02295 [Candidatus Moranbacteria bacterium]